MTAITDFLSSEGYDLLKRDKLADELNREYNEVTNWYPPPDYTGSYAADHPDNLFVVGKDLMKGSTNGVGGTKVRIKGVGLFSLIWEDPFANMTSLAAETNLFPHINCLRVPIIDEDGSNGGWDTKTAPQRDSYYNTTILPIINIALAHGWYVILDYHAVKPWNVPERLQKAKDFWAYMAPRFKGNPKIIFELFNEPSDPSVYPFPGTLANYLEYQVIYQKLADFVRFLAPRNLQLMGTPTYDTRSIYAQNYPFTSPNMAYVSHIYTNFTLSPTWTAAQLSDWWITTIPNNRPVFLTEFGWTTAPEIPGETALSNQPNYPAAMALFLSSQKHVHPFPWSYGSLGLGFLAPNGYNLKAFWETNLPLLTA